MPALESQMWAEEVADRALQQLVRLANQLLEDGRSTLFAFNSSDARYVQGACFVEIGVDDEDAAEQKRRRSAAHRMSSAIGRLEPAEFEKLCVIALESMGAYDIKLTPYRADQGIDFYGRLRLGSALADIAGYPPVLSKFCVWVVGQAKHFEATQVATFDLRELVGSIQLARSGEYGFSGDRYPDMKIRSCDPVFTIFMTSGTISRDAWSLCRNSGVIAIDGDSFSHILAQSDMKLSTANGQTVDELKKFIESSQLSRKQ
ncbi:restriction endonuclease [Streptomyces sclerotialus]|uniref:restriction endonuclease n=1 Tax=Streptomyces sclerotialus TaxID=1957 RepID=UPI0018CB8511